MKKIHLICNAHLDPVWLWQRAEGMAEAMATFRIAADFCEKYDDFVFNHNESVLYEWVMENDPSLFKRIKKLVKQGRWRVMSGWYLQPDAVMLSGESMIRQIRVGNEFFRKHFKSVPKTAIGFDAFGHSRGLVQILKKCGYDNYAYLRPRDKVCGPFVWEGFDGSQINTLKLYEWYNTPKGEAVQRLKSYVKDFSEREISCVTWGIGNHGGGPSEKDFLDIKEYASQNNEFEFIQSDFDAYFNDINTKNLDVLSESLTHCMVGCYTSMTRVKKGHRALENKLSMCEKMLCQSGINYDAYKLIEAEKALLFTEFHDVLPGSAIKNVENDSLNLIGYGLELTDRLITKSFFELCKGQKKAKDGEIPVLVYNPHPYEVEGDFEVEFQLAEQNHPSNGIFDVKMYDADGVYIPSQLEQEDSAHGMDWRKKLAFHKTLKPMSVTRLDCQLRRNMDFVSIMPCAEDENHIIFKNNTIDVKISKSTGFIEKYSYCGVSYLNSLKIKVFNDNKDPWGMEVDEFSDCIGEFALNGDVKIIENGDVRLKVMADFVYDKSYATVTYTLSKNSSYIDVDIKMLSNTKNVMYKLCADTVLKDDSIALGQTMFGTDVLRKGGKEVVFQKWCGLSDGNLRFSIINSGTYGGSFDGGEIRLSLLRTPVYSAHPVDGVELAPDTREFNHIDMGEREFSFRLCADCEYVDFEAEVFNQKPYILSMFPNGEGKPYNAGFEIDNKHIILSALRKCKKGTLVRLYNSSENDQSCKMDFGEKCFKTTLSPYEVKTFVKHKNSIFETDMLENKI